MRKIAITLTKGGTGKSTTAVNLAAGLASKGHRVLLVDTDTQGQASVMLGVEPQAGLAQLIEEEMAAEEVIVQARDNLSVLAGDHTLAGLKRTISLKDFGGEKVLTEALAPLRRRYDFIIMDTAPGWDSLTVNVLFYAQEILAPVSMEVLSLQGLIEFEQRIKPIQKLHQRLSLRFVLLSVL